LEKNNGILKITKKNVDGFRMAWNTTNYILKRTCPFCERVLKDFRSWNCEHCKRQIKWK